MNPPPPTPFIIGENVLLSGLCLATKDGLFEIDQYPMACWLLYFPAQLFHLFAPSINLLLVMAYVCCAEDLASVVMQ